METNDRLYALVRRIPRGFAMSYGALGRQIDPPVGPRRVGLAMKGCPRNVPWQRVVRSGGRLADLPSLGGRSLQRKLLEKEGVYFDAGGRIRPEFLVMTLGRSKVLTKAGPRSRRPLKSQ